jgi:N-acetylglucosamine-6-phosphate deacetylase
VLPLDACLRNLVAATGWAPARALAAATAHPARLLRCARSLGCLAPGAAADCVLLDAGLRPLQTFLAGCLVWSATWEAEGRPASGVGA